MKYKITFQPENKTIEVDTNDAHKGRVGLSGSILNVALEVAKIDIEHTCGGVAACSTCHIVVEDGFDACNSPSEAELDQLDNAPDVTLKSRLSCQCVPTGEKDITVRIPAWNRNLVKESPH
jgi:2Fe-2S ferredoxin